MDSQKSEPAVMSGPPSDRLEKARLEKLDKIAALGIDPWGRRFDGHTRISQARSLCPEESGVEGELVRVAGRIMRWNRKGKLVFSHIQDWTGQIQLMISRGHVGDEQWELIRNLDLGDLVGADGHLKRTNTGEISVFVDRLTILCKSLAPPPEKFHGIKDTETLLRQRYVDLIYNEGVLAKLLKRTRIIDSIRSTLFDEGFVEVETPVLHAIAGGAAARPFVTHHNTLDINLYLRIALELHLKRLMVGGVERVYEIGRVFRNEGIDATHNPEFTMLEVYQAYGNYETMMDLTEAIIVNAARTILHPLPVGEGRGEGGTPQTQRPHPYPLPEGEGAEQERLVLPWGEQTIDFTPPWPRRTYAELFNEHVGCDMVDAEAVQRQVFELAKEGRFSGDFVHAVETGHVHPDVIVHEVFEAVVEDKLAGPVFVKDWPASICPLTKRKPDDPSIAERFELFTQGMEIANAYTELNDPRLQEELFRTQLEGLPDEESMAKMDHDFIRALKVGMPPAGGLGIGVDRLVMLLTNSKSIRDVIFFPLMRPEPKVDLGGAAKMVTQATVVRGEQLEDERLDKKDQ